MPVAARMKIRYVKILGRSKAVYGWIGKRIPKDRSRSMFNCTMRAIGGAMVTQTNKQLKTFVFGGNLHLAVITAQRVFSILQSMRRRINRHVTWHKQRGSIVCTVREHMSQLGWVETGNFRWTATLSKKQIHLEKGLDKEQK